MIEVDSLAEAIKVRDIGRIDAVLYGEKSANIALNNMSVIHIKPLLHQSNR